MILGVGVDICQNNRVNQDLANRVLNDEEFKIYNALKLESRKIEFLASRFAVKEAIIKALSQSNFEVFMRDIIILNDDLNRPYVKNPKYNSISINISISHEKEYSIGFAVIEKID